MKEVKDLLFERLLSYWGDDDNFSERLKTIIYEEDVKGAETLLDFCREDYDELASSAGDSEQLDDIWDICNWYLDLLQNNNMTTEFLISRLKGE